MGGTEEECRSKLGVRELEGRKVGGGRRKEGGREGGREKGREGGRDEGGGR